MWKSHKFCTRAKVAISFLLFIDFWFFTKTKAASQLTRSTKQDLSFLLLSYNNASAQLVLWLLGKTSFFYFELIWLTFGKNVRN
jgi:hypothetical protein